MEIEARMVCAALLIAAALSARVPDLHSYGEPENGFPCWEERMVQVMTNRSRADPAADLAECAVCAEKACYAPVPPLVWSYDLNRAARFHCSNMASCGCGLMHDSPCNLVAEISDLYDPGPCDGSASCACEGGTCGCSGTSWSDRIEMFGVPPSAENAAGGSSDPWEVFYMWLWEPDSDTTCGWRMTNGHRANILGDHNGQIGVGHDSGYWVQDFSYGSPDRKILAASHYPNSPGAVDFRANWYDPSGGPSQAMVNVDGTCHAMTLERGAEGNGTYMFSGTAAGVCPRYYFLFKDSGGSQVTYPDTGSFAIGTGCADWDPSRPPAGPGCECTPECTGKECGDNGCGASCGDCGEGYECSDSGLCVPFSLPDPEPDIVSDTYVDLAADQAGEKEEQGETAQIGGGCGCFMAT